MSLPKEEVRRRKIAELKSEMRAHLALAMEKATIIDELEGGVYSPQSSKAPALTPEQLAAEIAKSHARRGIPLNPNIIQ